MSKFTKVLVTIGVVLISMFIIGVIGGIRSDAGYNTPGFLSLIFFAAMIGALRAIWKKPKKEDENDNNSVLQK